MAITYDNKTDGGENTSSYSHNNSGNLVILFVCWDATGDSMSSVTYDSEAMTLAVAYNGWQRIEIWFKADANTGNNTVSMSDGGAFNDYHTYTASFSGADTSSPEDDNSNNEGASGAPSVIIQPTVDNTLVVACQSTDDGTAPSTGSGETVIYNSDNGTWSSGASYDIQTTKENQTMDWSGVDDVWTAVASAFLEGGLSPNKSESVSVTESVGISVQPESIGAYPNRTSESGLTKGWKKGVKIYTP